MINGWVYLPLSRSFRSAHQPTRKMDGLILLVALIPIALVILLIANLVRMSSLAQEVRQLRHALKNQGVQRPVGIPKTASERTKPKLQTPKERSTPQQQAPPPTEKIPNPKNQEPTRPATTAVPPRVIPTTAPKPRVVKPLAPKKRVKKENWFKQWLQRNPDFEKFIGENLMNKVGIGIFVIGIALFLKLAIDRGYINDVGKVIVGLVSGGMLMFFAHRLRIVYRAFSSVLIGGAITIFYFTFWMAYTEFGLIEQAPTFIILIVVTALTVALSILCDRKELAILSVLGGFATPFLASSGSGNYVVLFSYLTILNMGMLVLSEKKKWLVINVLTLLFTWALFGVWVGGDYHELVPPPMRTALLFASGFFGIFFTMNMRYNIRHEGRSAYYQYALILVNTGAFYALALAIVQYTDVKLSGLITACVGLFYLVNVYFLHRNKRISQQAFYLLLGLVLTFISLVAPVQLDGNHITLFWAAEAVLLVWLSQRASKLAFLRAAFFVTVLMMISWIMDLLDVYTLYGTTDLSPILNPGFLTSVVVIASLLLNRLLIARTEQARLFLNFSTQDLNQILTVVSILSIYLGGLIELNHQIRDFFNDPSAAIAVSTYTLVYVLILEHLSKGKDQLLRVLAFTGLGVLLIHHISARYGDARSAASLQQSGRALAPILFHLIKLPLLIYAIYRVSQLARELFPRDSTGWRYYLWLICGFVVVLCSLLEDQRKVAYPILWAILSFAFMFYGMRTRLKTVRLIALSLFGITVIKLFLHDISGASETGRVIAFILLGVLLLVVSFMYQKLKGLLIDGDPKPTDP